MYSSKDFFKKDGIIAKNLPDYEVRTGQVRMAEAIEEAIFSSKNLIVEAGPGIGKSLAYLVPFINWAYSENKKVVVSTYTKTLQSQLYIKDLPFLRKTLGMDFRYVLCVGSDNYVCLRKARKVSAGDFFRAKGKKRDVEKILEWLENTETGLAQDMDFVPDRGVWEKFSRDYETCIGRKCEYYNECFYKRMREKEAKAHILVANHSLLFTNMISGRKVLPEFDALVLDEAHTLEDAATTHFTRTVTNTSIQRLVSDISHLVLPEGAEPDEINIAFKKLKSVSKMFFDAAERNYGKDEKTAPFESYVFPFLELRDAMKELEDILDGINRNFYQDEPSDEINSCLEKCRKEREDLNFVFGQETCAYVYWLDIEPRKTGAVYAFNAAPIDISGDMRNYIFGAVCPIILTSATLAMPGETSSFDFIKSRLGIDDALEVIIGSPYDYANNVLMYLAKGIADPTSNFDVFQKEALDEIIKIYDIMGGRMFVLFTSFSMLNKAAEEITQRRSDINILRQGQMPRYVLLDVFKKNKNTILMGTTTFWQGVDVSGNSLECVIITKLPFSVPTDPVTAARISAIESDGRDAFMEYQVPKAVMMFKQGFGRLIRSSSDRGVVAVLDSRIKTRHYGKSFLEALPECRKSSDIKDIEKFFSQPV